MLTLIAAPDYAIMDDVSVPDLLAVANFLYLNGDRLMCEAIVDNLYDRYGPPCSTEDAE